MRLPRDLSGEEVARLLGRHYGYQHSRNRGSHMTVTAETPSGTRHSVTVPRHRNVSVGTLDAIVGDVAKAFGLAKTEVLEMLFG